jgi:hypothetical protein
MVESGALGAKTMPAFNAKIAPLWCGLHFDGVSRLNV